MEEPTQARANPEAAAHAAVGSTIAHITVGVADIDAALGLWVETFGLSVFERRNGADGELGRIWGIAPGRIVAQAMVGTPGVDSGRLHLVEFESPDPPVRRGAASTDLGPKNIDLIVRDLPARYEELREAGHEFRSPWVAYEFEGMEVREVQMPGHDDTNIVLVEVVGRSFPFTPEGYAGMTSFVTVNPDPEAEVGFYRDLFGLPIAHELELGGPEIEKMVGLPPGTVLDLRVVGPREYLFGRAELVHYRGVDGTNRYPLARPPARGALHAAFFVRSIEAFRRRAGELQIELVDHGRIDTIFGSGPAVTVYTPAGLRVDVLERASR